METSATHSLFRLIERAKDGSRSALGDLMASCRPWLRRRVRLKFPRGLARKEDASDLVQECQSLAAASFAQFRGGSPAEFRAWLAGILDRRILQAIRFWGAGRRDRRREQPVAAAASSVWELEGSSTTILERLCRWEECDRLKLAASWCRDDDIELISQHLFVGRSHEEIAQELGVASATVRQRYCRAVRRVGEAMQLLDLMTRNGFGGTRQDVIGLHRFRGEHPDEISTRLRLPKTLVARWIVEAKPLLHAMEGTAP
jgi:RNA polymerase sigma-70 factor (ECF subfamily)